uniref:Tyrosine-protein kinase n=1 Tax=Parastrongyloides trichosuri TaxID=131310 RepID=A0A0N4ZLX0_PARTI
MDCRRPSSVDSINIQRHHHSSHPQPPNGRHLHHQKQQHQMPATINGAQNNGGLIIGRQVKNSTGSNISPKINGLSGNNIIWPSRDDLLNSPVGGNNIVTSDSHGSFCGLIDSNPYPSFSSMTNGSSRSRNSIATGPQQERHHNLYIVLYDFHGVCEEQMTVREGDRIRILGYNSTGEWCEAQLISSKRNDKRRLNCIGWIPSSYIASLSSLEKFNWYHGKISRNDSEVLLSSGINGSFLVRESESSPGQFSITVRFDTRVYHYRINVDRNNYLYITPEAKFKTLSELVEHHSIEADGLICHLQYPAAKKQKGPTIFSLSPTRSDEWEMDRNEIVMRNQIGSGQYGDVYEGYWKTTGKTVAVKTLKEETMPVHEFLAEAAIMKDLQHPNLVSLIGICTREAPLFIITEFMSKGNLLDYLRKIEKDSLPSSVILYMASQVASGMAYLESKNIIHRDLAARNCLVSDEYTVKVADFGLARFLRDDTYTAKEGSKFPIKWCCPGGLAYNTFSTKSDVWSFGVLLWEIATYGMAPYPGVELSNVYTLLERGFRMDEPQNCPYPLYRLMLQCWNWAPADRPTFNELHQTLQSVLQQNTLASELERSCHFGITNSRRRGSSPLTDNNVTSFNGNNNRIRHSINVEGNRNDVTTFRSPNNHHGSSPSTRRSSTASGSVVHHHNITHQNVNTSHPVPPPAAAKKNALKAFLQTSVSSDDSPTTTNPSILMYELQQKSRKIAPQFDTLPKQQRIEEFLESMNANQNIDDAESNGYGAKSDIIRSTSQDSLDAIPTSASHQNELLLQLKNRLKKTNTMENITPIKEKDESPKVPSQSTISPTHQFKSMINKNKKLDDINEKTTKTKGPTPPPKTISMDTNGEIDAENELKAKIRKLRHVETVKPTISVSPVSTTPSPTEEMTANNKGIETARIRMIPTQRGSSLQGRPYSIQPGDINSSNLRSSSTTSSCRSLSSTEEAPINSINVAPQLPPKRISLGGGMLSSNNSKKEVPKQYSTLQQKPIKPQGLIERFLKTSDKKVKHNGSVDSVISTKNQLNEKNSKESSGTFPKSKSTRIIGEKELELVKKKEAENKVFLKKCESEDLNNLYNNMNRTNSLREIVINNENGSRNSIATSNIRMGNCFIDSNDVNTSNDINPIMKSKKRYSLMNEKSNNGNTNMINQVSKEHLADLYQKIDDCLTSFRNKTLNNGGTHNVKPSAIVAAKKLLKAVDNNDDKKLYDLLKSLDKLLLQFHSKCTIYAENISPYSKFRYNDLLRHVEEIQKQLNDYTKDPKDGVFDEMEKIILPDCNNSLKQVMQLVNK